MEAVFTNEAVVFGILIVVLALVFYTSGLSSRGWQRFYTIFPPLLLCYFIPAILVWPLGLIADPADNLYFVASRFLLPAALILLCINIDFKGLIRLDRKSTRLNSSHVATSYAVFCLKKKTYIPARTTTRLRSTHGSAD